MRATGLSHSLLRVSDWWVHVQGSVALFYNWLKIGGAPHTWVTDVIQDFALPVNFVGLSTEDRRFIYPQKEVNSISCGVQILCCAVLGWAVLCCHIAPRFAITTTDHLGSIWLGQKGGFTRCGPCVHGLITAFVPCLQAWSQSV